VIIHSIPMQRPQNKRLLLLSFSLSLSLSLFLSLTHTVFPTNRNKTFLLESLSLCISLYLSHTRSHSTTSFLTNTHTKLYSHTLTQTHTFSQIETNLLSLSLFVCLSHKPLTLSHTLLSNIIHNLLPSIASTTK
jgi:hypothetical protein